MPHISSEPKRMKGLNTVDLAFSMRARKELDATIGRMFHTGGLSFNLSKDS